MVGLGIEGRGMEDRGRGGKNHQHSSGRKRIVYEIKGKSRP